MNLPKQLFKKGTFELKESARNYLKTLVFELEFKRFNDSVGYTPPPDDPCPDLGWPGPIPRSKRNLFLTNLGNLNGPPWPQPCLYSSNLSIQGLPNPDDIDPWPWPLGPLVLDIVTDRIFDMIRDSPIRKNTYDFIDVVKREKIALEALSDLSENLSSFQQSLLSKVKCLK